jgi:hypothetical protein
VRRALARARLLVDVDAEARRARQHRTLGHTKRRFR